MKPLNNIFLIGPMGAGKTSIGKLLAKKLNWDFYDSDAELEDKAGVSISWIFDVEGEAGMREREVKVIEELTQYKNIVLATGGGSILRPENRKALAARGTVIYLQTSIDEQVSRTANNRDHRPLLQVADTRARIIELAGIRNPLYESIADMTLSTLSGSTHEVVDNIMAAIS